MQGGFTLEILTPDRTVFKGTVLKATMPGAKAPFVILHNHAPIISLLQHGRLVWNDGESDLYVEITNGFVEVNENVVTVCVELK